MNRSHVMGALLTVALAAGCGVNKKVPDDMQGRFPTTHLLTDEMVVIVEANAISVEGCDVNCGVDRLELTDVTYSPSEGTVTFTSEHCTGTIERSGRDISITARPVPGATGDALAMRDISITARPVPGATGDALAIRNMTCANISGLLRRGS